MKKPLVAFIVSFASLIVSSANAEQLIYSDPLIRKVLTAYAVEEYIPDQPKLNDEVRLGRALFFDPILSGQKTLPVPRATFEAQEVLTD